MITEQSTESVRPIIFGRTLEGKYIVFVGSLTVPLHNAWADAAIARQKEKYPKMTLVADRFGVAESLDDSVKTARDQMRANPDLKGILAFGSQGPIGAAKAVEDRDAIGKVAVTGPFSPGQGAKYIKSGAITEGFIWNPMLAGEVIVRVVSLLSTNDTRPANSGLYALRASSALVIGSISVTTCIMLLCRSSPRTNSQ